MKVLVADDDITSRTLVAGVLKKWGYDVVTACDGDQATNILEADEPPAVAVLDWMMPGLDGVEICRKVKNRPMMDDRFVYVILLTARTATEDLAAAMATGADDYIVKPFNNEELRARVRAGERIAELQHRLIEANHRLEKQANHDLLTGLLNRGAILEQLEIELERANRHKAPLSVAMLDIDHFKRVNDTLGHSVGDEVLRQVAQRMEDGLRKYDLVGRYGGEEFVVVAPGVDFAGGNAVFDRIRRAVADKTFRTPKGPLDVTVSIGVAISDEDVTSEKLVENADTALYQAKSEGRNRVCFAGDISMQTMRR